MAGEREPVEVRTPIERRLAEISGPDGGGEPLVRRLVGGFLERAPQQLAELATAAADGDMPTAATVAHRLVGTAGNLGADELAIRCSEVDEAARAGQRELVAAGLPPVESAFADVEPVLLDLRRRWEAER